MSGIRRPKAESELSQETPVRRASPWALLIVGLVAASLVWFIVDRWAPFFQMSEELRALNPPYANEVAERVIAEQGAADYKNAAATIGMFGVAVGGVFGLVQGIAVRTFGAVVLGLLGGAVLGGAFGAAGGAAEIAIRHALQMRMIDDMYKTLAMHTAAFAIAGIGVGLAGGLPARGRAALRGASAGLLAGLLAGVVYPSIAGAAFPMDNSDLPLPDGSMNRLLWLTLPAALMALAVGRAARRAGAPRPPSLQSA